MFDLGDRGVYKVVPEGLDPIVVGDEWNVEVFGDRCNEGGVGYATGMDNVKGLER